MENSKLLLSVILLLVRFNDGALLAGGAGRGLLFQGQRSDVATVHLPALSPDRAASKAVTFEFWLKKTDQHTVACPFSYASYNDSAIPEPTVTVPEAYMFEIGEYGVWKMYFGSTTFDCPRANCTFGWTGEWQHVALAYNASLGAGYMKAYRNGRQVFDSSLLQPDPVLSFAPVRFPGVLLLGQNAQGWLSGLSKWHKIDGVMDEVRVWSYERTSEQIMDSMRLTMREGDPGLLLSLPFNEGSGAAVARDVSGNGNDAVLGSLPDPRSVIPVGAEAAAQAATLPELVISSAPVFGGDIEVWATPGLQAPITLRAWVDGSITNQLGAVISSLPSHGTLHAVAGGGRDSMPSDDTTPLLPALSKGAQLAPSFHPDPDGAISFNMWYMPGPNFGDSGEDNFTYTVRDDVNEETATVVIRCPTSGTALHVPPSHEMVTAEDEATLLVLGGSFFDGTQADTVLASLPEAGRIYDVAFESSKYMGFAPPFSKYEQVNTTDRSRPVSADMLPYRVADDAGAVLYVPPENIGGLRVTFAYKHVHRQIDMADGWRLQTAEALVAMYIVSVNDPPRALPMKLCINALNTDPTLVELSATDIDPTFSPHTEFTITSPPRGMLFQSGLGETSAEHHVEALNFSMEPFSVFQFATSIPPFDPQWGPAFSSQLNTCASTCCNKQETCNKAGCEAVGDIWPCSELRHGYAIQVVGPSTFSPGEPLHRHAWIPAPGELGTSDRHDFLVLEYDIELYISSVAVLELLSQSRARKSKVSRISAAQFYRGNKTSWTILWEGTPDPPRGTMPRDLTEFEFRPPHMCRRGAFGRFLRVDFTIHGGSQISWPAVTAVRMEGTMSPPRGLVMSPDNKILYKAPDGFHGSALQCGEQCGPDGLPFDWFAVTPSDCVAQGQPINITVEVVPPPSPGAASTSTALSQTLNTIIGKESTDMMLGAERVRQALAESYGDEVVSSCKDISHRIAVLDDGGATFLDLQGTEIAADGSLVELSAGNRGPSDGVFVVQLGSFRGFSRARLEVWTTMCGITARYRVAVEAVCPPEEDDPLVCTRDPESCPAGFYYSSEMKLCQASRLSKELLLSLVLGFAIVVLLLVMAALLLVRRNRRLRRDLACMIKAKDTLDLDSPLTKVIRYLDEVRGHIRNKKLRERANDLRMELLNSDNVTVPNMQQVTEALNSDMAKFVMPGAQSELSTAPVSRRSFNMSLVASDSGLWACMESIPGGIGEHFFFDTLSFFDASGEMALQMAVMKLMQRWDLFKVLKVPQESIQGYISRIQAGYMDNPYHGPAHAVDVTCRLGAVLHHTGIGDALMAQNVNNRGPTQLFSMIIAAAVHDYGHPGVSNAYTVNTHMDVAKRFNDQATLENDALYHALQMMESPAEESIIRHMSSSEKRQLRSHVISLVLGTDMSKHFELMTAFQNKVVDVLCSATKTSKGQVLPTRQFKDLNDDQQKIVAVIAMKIADLGHSALPMDLHLKWLQRLEDEFFAQGDLERQRGMEVSPLMDRSKPGPTDPKNQLGFYSVIILPMYRAFCKAFPGTQPLVETLEANKCHWEMQLGPIEDDNLMSGHNLQTARFTTLRGHLHLDGRSLASISRLKHPSLSRGSTTAVVAQSHYLSSDNE